MHSVVKMPRGRTRVSAPLDKFSSLNNYVICNLCHKKFIHKYSLPRHLNNCGRDRVLKLTCKWCNVVFKSSANLACHAQKVHGDMRYTKMHRKKSSELNKCNVCNKLFAEHYQLRYHIRRQHFNLKAKIPYCYQKKVNQVWFERVLNSNNVMEIRKTGPNTLVMRRLDENTAIKVADQETEEIDLSDVYPTGEPNGTTECRICSKEYRTRSLKKHMEEVHYNKMKHHCNNCNLKFKRLYQFLKHVCSKRRAPRGVKQVSDDIIITSYESLAAVKG